jgi:hypothetical protein
MKKKITSKIELEMFLKENITNGRGSYFIVMYNNHTELLWFTKYEKFCEDGSDWFLEAPNYIRRVKVETKKDKSSYKRYGYVIKNDGYAYEIDTPQVAPFLPEEIEIEYLSYKEKDAVDWMLEHTYTNYEWKN